MCALLGMLLLLLTVAASAQQGWSVDTVQPARWRPMPGWLGNPSDAAAVQATSEGLRFLVPEPGRGMKWLTSARWVNTLRFRYLTVRYRAKGIAPRSDDYFMYLNDTSGVPDSQRYLLKLADLRADGGWHLAVVDLHRWQIRPYLTQIALQVQAAEPNAEVVVSEIAFREALPQGVSLPQEPLPPVREVPVDLSEWRRLQPQPDWLANASTRASVEWTREGLRFRVPEAGKGMKWSLHFAPPLRPRETPYIVIQYRARGVAGTGDYFLYTAPSQPTLPQSEYIPARLEEVLSVGKWQTMAVRLPEAALDELATLAIQVQAQEADAELVIRSATFASRPEVSAMAPEEQLPEPHRVMGRFLPLDLGGHYHVSLQQVLSGLPLTSYRFGSAQVVGAGVPFRVSTAARNAAAVQGETGVITVPIPSAAQYPVPGEMYMLLAAGMPGWEEPSYGGGSLYRVVHPHRFVVELRYADGSSEQIFPLRVATRRHEVARGIDVYVVPVAKRLREVRLHDRMRLGEFGLCALTLNTGTPRFSPSLWMRPVPQGSKRAALNAPSPVRTASLGGVITLQNANLRLRIGIEQGIRLQEFTLIPMQRNALIRAVPLFAVRSWDGSISASSADYRVANLSTQPQAVELYCTPPRDGLPRVRLRVGLDSAARVQIELRARNLGNIPHRWVLSLPAEWAFRIGENDVYTYPLRTALVSDRDTDLRYRYSGSLPLQMIDISNLQMGVGIGILSKNLQGVDRYVQLTRRDGITTVATEWRCDPLAAGETVQLQTEIFLHPGDWKETLAHYKRWVSTWYRPLAPRKPWFRCVFAFRQDYITEGLYDRDTRSYRFGERIELAKKAFGACDYLHIFDWGTTPRGRVGDYDPWGNLLSSAEMFRQAVEVTQAQGTPVGLYIEGYLADERSLVGQAHREEWGWRGRDGRVHYWSPGSTEFFMCPGAEGWQQYLQQTYARVRQQTGAIGFYIDQYGLLDRDCFAQEHQHPPHWHLLPAEGRMTRRIREVLPPEVVLYTEYFPPDIHTPLQDGSFDYAINYYQLFARGWTPLPLRLGRFAFPDFKVFQIIVCDYPTGSNEEAVHQVFFNGDGYWLQGDPDTWFTPETLSTLRQCIRILRTHADAFASDDCEPLVPTLVPGVFANRFTASGSRKTVWTLYNGNWRSVQGQVLAVPHVRGARYVDAWNNRPLQPTVKGGKAYLRLTLPPHAAGCVVQVR
jgi:hypothetical protein